MALSLLFASAAALAAGEDRDSGAVIQRTDIRSGTLSLYKYEPHPGVSSPLPPFLAHEAAPPPSQGLVKEAPSGSREPHVMNHLHAAILREHAEARTALVASRLGIGVSSMRAGRYLSAGAATAFYIPVAVGVYLDW